MRVLLYNGLMYNVNYDLQNSESNVEMRFFNDSVMDACDFLKELTEERADCLFAFVICRPLVQWLKDSMKKG